MRSIKLPSWIEGLLGLNPLPVPPHVFSIRPGAVAYGQFARLSARGANGAGRAFDFRAYGSVELPPDCFQPGLMGGPLRDPATLDQALSALVERLGLPIEQASLVLPDAWLRVSFTEVGELPRAARERTEVLRWKLKRLVPFRVEDLRIAATEVAPLASQQEPHRLLLGFALESLLSQMEDSFDRAGIRLGQISNLSLASLDALRPGLGEGLSALAAVEEDGYTLVFARQGEPVLHRFKAAAGEMASASHRGLISRDLKLTRQFLEEHFGEEPLERVVLAVPENLERMWLSELEENLGGPVELLSRAHLPSMEPADPPSGTWPELPPWRDLAPMIGAAAGEVS